jgi:hypothetical protein
MKERFDLSEVPMGDLLEELYARSLKGLSENLASALRAPNADSWVSQDGSPLGNRRHCAAVRRRMEAGDIGAAKQGKRFLLTREALANELCGFGAARTPAGVDGADSEPSDLEGELRAKLRAVR